MTSINGKIIWLTGLSGAGKTTIGLMLVDVLKNLGIKTYLLDGDVVREFFESDLGYTRSERIFNVRRIAFAADVLSLNDITVVVANMAPYYEVRDFIRRKLGEKYIQIYLATTFEKVKERDVKGLYAKFLNGTMNNLIGADDAYEIPRRPHLTINTAEQTVDESMETLCRYLQLKHHQE